MAIGTAAALALALAGAGASAYNTKRTLDKKDQVAAESVRKQAANQRATSERINQTVEDTRKSRSEPARKAAADQYLAQIQKSLGQANAGLATRGLSSQFDEAAGGAQGQVADYGGNIADLFARMDAPTTQRRAEGAAFGDLGMDLGVQAGNVQGDAFLNSLKQNSIRRNPWLDLASGLASGVASAGLAPGVAGSAPAAGGWLGANAPALKGLTSADPWLKATLFGKF